MTVTVPPGAGDDRCATMSHSIEMANRENISVSFTPHQAAFLARCVASGRYQSASEVVREGLRLLEDQHRLRLAELDLARSLVREGATDLERGRIVDRETFFREWDEELDAIEEPSRRERE